MAEGKIIDKEFKGNVKVMYDGKQEVKIWVCNGEGQNVFRFKTIGKVFASDTDITIVEEKKLRS